MWKLLFLLVTTVAAVPSPSYDEEMSCRRLIYEHCQKNSSFRLLKNIPGSEEELENECKFSMEFFKCANSIRETCHESELERKSERDLELNIRRICDKENSLHDELVENLPCIKKNLHKLAPCVVLDDDKIETFTEELASIGISDVAAPHTAPVECLFHINILGCIIAKIDKDCGDVAKDAVVEVFQGIDTYFQYCRPGIKENLGDIAKMMKTVAENEETEDEMGYKKR